uniref:EF-hand domain-containing protein n=1 Tax=Balaenoptera musculus TaxID=9771 RepID=A0A8C0D5R2_BALMU
MLARKGKHFARFCANWNCTDIHSIPTGKEWMRHLFQTLDVNREGRLCVNDLAVGFRLLGLHCTEGELRKIVQAGDKDLDGQLDFEKFAHYLQDHEKKLRLVFKSLDKKNDGRIDAPLAGQGRAST